MACHFKDTLHYSSPANGGRGIVRTGMLIPESVELFVCPFACGRHGSISAVKQELKHRLSYLYVNQADIINGYDDLILPAVGELLETLSPRPKVVLIFVSCLDDLIGTDHEALQEKLSEKYPDVKFRSCHMNPISKGSKTPPAISIQNNIYSLLEVTEEKDRGVNCIGNLVPILEDNEIYDFLKSYGFDRLKHIAHYETFEDYQEMAKSRYNLVIAPVGKQAAEQMEEKHGISYAFLPVSYRLEQIEEVYRELGSKLEWLKEQLSLDDEQEVLKEKKRFTVNSEQEILKENEQLTLNGEQIHLGENVQLTDEAANKRNNVEFDFTLYKNAAEDAIQRARKAIGDTPIVVDASAVKSPFGLARALMEYGFHVIRVQAPECIGIDKKDYEWVVREHPEIEIVQSQHHNTVLRENQIPESIAIGVDGAYLAGSKYVVDLFDDEGMYGYHGVCCLMEKLERALEQPVDLENMIHEYGLVV